MKDVDWQADLPPHQELPGEYQESQWFEIVDQYGNSISPDLWACRVCGTVSIALEEKTEECRVCELVARLAGVRS